MEKLWRNKNAGTEITEIKGQVMLPEGYKWKTFDNGSVKKIREFINKQFEGINYTEEHVIHYFESGAIFKGIIKDDELVGLISVKFTKMKVNKGVKTVSEINFLSIRERDRGKGLINFLGKEVIRISVNKGITIGIYTSIDKHLNMIKECHYYHYLSNIKKLLETGFIEDEKAVEIINKDGENGENGENGEKKLEEMLKINTESLYKINRRVELTDKTIEKLNKYVEKYDISKIYGLRHEEGIENIKESSLFEYYTTEDVKGEVKALLVFI
jgi:hypothetical protein